MTKKEGRKPSLVPLPGSGCCCLFYQRESPTFFGMIYNSNHIQFSWPCMEMIVLYRRLASQPVMHQIQYCHLSYSIYLLLEELLESKF